MSPSFAALLVLVSHFPTASPTLPAQGRIVATAPDSILELQEWFEVDVEGLDLGGPIVPRGAWLDGRDVGQDVLVRQVHAETRDDNGDGVPESVASSYRVDLSALASDPGQLLELDFAARSRGGWIGYRTATRVVANAEVSVPERAGDLRDPIVVAVTWEACWDFERAIEFQLDGHDVSGLIGILDVERVQAVMAGPDQAVVETYEIDLSGLSDRARPDSVLTTRVSVTSTSGRTSSAGASTAFGTLGSYGDDDGDNECVKAALQAFINAMGFTKGDDGSVTSSRDPKTVDDAVNALQQAIRDCEVVNVDGTFDLVDAAGNPIKVRVVLKGTGDASVSGSADVVIAVGGDGGSSSSDGGDGTATNTQKGGAAIGHGGDGGSTPNSSGKGGNGKGTAASGTNGSPAGTGIGGGGRGGAPTGGGTGSNGGSGTSSSGSGPGTSGGTNGGGAGGANTGGAGGFSNSQGSNTSSGLS